MIKTLLAILSATFLLSACTTTGSSPPGNAPGGIEPDILFYRINSLGQQTKLTLVPNSHEPGCHNLLKTSRVHRVQMYGFDYCEVYAEDDCKADTVMPAQWMSKRNKDPEKQEALTKLTKGGRWVLDPGANARVSSWQCFLP